MIHTHLRELGWSEDQSWPVHVQRQTAAIEGKAGEKYLLPPAAALASALAAELAEFVTPTKLNPIPQRY